MDSRKIKIYDGPDLDDKKKKQNKMTAILACIVSGIIILFYWSFIIALSATYSERAGQLWFFTFLFAFIIDYGAVEFFVLYESSRAVFRNEWDIKDQP
jgi:hypothetical protein